MKNYNNILNSNYQVTVPTTRWNDSCDFSVMFNNLIDPKQHLKNTRETFM
jgi:hypothetical protein